MLKCSKCKQVVNRIYDCEHTKFEKYCNECYTEIHYDLTEKN